MSNKLEQKYSRFSFFRFLMSKNFDFFYYFGGIFLFSAFILVYLFFEKKTENYYMGPVFLIPILLLCILLVTKNFFKSLFEFYKKDSYNSFLVSNFIYKTKLIRNFSKDIILSSEAKLSFVKARNLNMDINEEIHFFQLSNEINNLKKEADNMYSKEYFIIREKYEVLFSSFLKLFCNDYIFKTLYEDYFWNTKENFNNENLKDESSLEHFDKLIEDLLKSTLDQQAFLLKKLKERKILPKDFVMPA